MNATDLSKRRRDMVKSQIANRDIGAELVLKAMGKVPREKFVPEDLRDRAYDDAPLPIGAGQTISQPYIVAYMTEALGLEGGEIVLEIGTGSGYAAAILGEIAGRVFTVERIKELADKAAETLAELGYDNVLVRHGDGTRGWAVHAPYDGIVVTASGPKVPQTLKSQLKIGGCLVMPVGDSVLMQELVRVTREGENDYREDSLVGVRFVPLIGSEGWGGEDQADRAQTPA